MPNDKPIEDFFKGKNIFITGGSGFLGKALIEKLLRSCPDVGNIYVLLRPKKGKALYERVEQILSSPLFDVVKTKFPENLKKVLPINGDTRLIGLGISETDRKVLISEINIFVHAAASVRFDDLITSSIISNLRSAREAALLVLEMKNIELFQHVSTSYCNIDNGKVIKEILYPAPQSWSEAISIVENGNPDITNSLIQKYIGEFPNTYTFTKRLAEHCINDLLVGKVPTIICRPTVVIGSIKEPFVGWTDNFNGPVGLLLAGATGFLRIVYADPNVDTDYTAIDNVVKCMISSIWQKVVFGDVNELTIIHMSKNDSVPYKLGKFLEYGKSFAWDCPFEKKIWFPQIKMTMCWYEYYVRVILFHVIPALFLDMILRIAGYPSIALKIQKKIYITNSALECFMFMDWKFENENMLKLFEALPVAEIDNFNFMVVPTDEQHLYNYFLQGGKYCRVHLLKESKEITRSNRTRNKSMYYLDKALKIITFVLGAWLFFIRINFPEKLWTSTCNYWHSL